MPSRVVVVRAVPAREGFERKIRKRRDAFANIWLSACLSAFVSAPLTLASPSELPASKRTWDALEGPLSSRDTESLIRALARSTRPEAAAELAELSHSPEVTSHASALLLAISTLARFTEDEIARKALLRHLRTPAEGDAPALRLRAREVAAIALAHGRDPDSVRALVLLADGPPDADSMLRDLSRTALRAYPPSEASIAQALPWLDAAARNARHAWLARERSVLEKRRLERCHGARAGLASWTTGAKATRPSVAFADVLSDLATCPTGQEPTREDWIRLAERAPAWALRGLAAVGGRATDAGWQKRAETELRSNDPVARSAAAWFLSTTDREAAERLARDTRPEVRAAARNQLNANQGKRGELRESCPPLLARQSTQRLFRDFTVAPKEENGQLLGCLAGRLRRTAGPGMTASEIVLLAERSPPPTRVLIAAGLGDARPEVRSLARGTVARLYAEESDAYVRRFLCLSLEQLGIDGGDPIAGDLMLDSDPVCRAIATADHPGVAPVTQAPWDVHGQPTLSTVSSGKHYLAARVLAVPLVLSPAPDGFVGVRVIDGTGADPRGLDFVDCRGTAEPAWACGKAALRPR